MARNIPAKEKGSPCAIKTAWIVAACAAIFGLTGSAPDSTGASSSDQNSVSYRFYPDGIGASPALAEKPVAVEKPAEYLPVLSVVNGDRQLTSPDGPTDDPVVVSLTKGPMKTSVVNAPVTFTVLSRGGSLAGSLKDCFTASGISTFTVNTDSYGCAQVFYRSPPVIDFTSKIRVTSGSASLKITVTTTDGEGTFDQPTNVQVDNSVPFQFTVTWVNHASKATAIVIEQSTDQKNWAQTVKLSNPNATSYTVKGIEPGETYCFRVHATN